MNHESTYDYIGRMLKEQDDITIYGNIELTKKVDSLSARIKRLEEHIMWLQKEISNRS